MLDTPETPVEPRAVEPRAAEPRAAESGVDIRRVGDVQVVAHSDGYSVTIQLDASPPDADWVKLFEHPPVLVLTPPARRPAISDATIEILVRNEEQMSASVQYAELAVAEANRVYNDEVLPRRERHQRIRDAARTQDDVGLDAMSRAANAL